MRDEIADSIHDFIDKQTWRNAVTYKSLPHEYIVRDNIVGADSEFVNTVIYIRENGMPMNFFSKQYIYLRYKNYVYWTMGDTLENTIIINRCDLNEYKIYITKRR